MPAYTVSLDIFRGPLELLLRLIEAEELDITAISLAAVADQYLVHLKELQRAEPGSLADFLVVAAELLVIKSRVLLPQPQEDDEEEEQAWESDLMSRLQAYKRFKEMACRLGQIEQRGQRSYVRLAPPPEIPRHVKPGQGDIEGLLRAFEEILERNPPRAPVDEVVPRLVVHIEDRIESILAKVCRHDKVTFSEFMREARSRMEIIVTFLAMLELIKRQRIRVSQEKAFGEIYLEQCQDEDAIGETEDAAETSTPQE
ncbi:MAG: segregation/condensation protein A [Chloroflexota bacterium]|nr:segregation/condensation protein A [Chloroflexota bacterium]